MVIKKIECITFSPTGGCLKIAKSICNLLVEYDISLINITRVDIRDGYKSVYTDTDYVIIVVPVYADTIPDIVKLYLNQLSLMGKAITIIAGYGNIDVGRTLFDISKIIEKKGNVVCSACEIVIAHSYNNEKLHIAESEPSVATLQSINNFILSTIEKLNHTPVLTLCKATIPKGHKRIMTYLPQKLLPHIFIKEPKVNKELCSECRACIKVCPSGAIMGDLEIDRKKCIRCLACVKYCTKNARVLKTKTNTLIRMLRKDELIVKGNKYYFA